MTNTKQYPSEETEDYWILAMPDRTNKNYKESPKRTKKQYIERIKMRTNKNGKWLIFEQDDDMINALWCLIKEATMLNKLTGMSKCSTKKGRIEGEKDYCICVYCDVGYAMEVREKLKAIGITWKIGYKTDKASIEGKYAKNGDKNICLYWI